MNKNWFFLYWVVQLFQIPYYAQAWQPYPSIITKFTFSVVIMMSTVLLYFSSKSISPMNILLSRYILISIIIIKILSISLFSTPSLLGTCNAYCTISLSISFVKVYSSILSTLSDCFFLSITTLIFLENQDHLEKYQPVYLKIDQSRGNLQKSTNTLSTSMEVKHLNTLEPAARKTIVGQSLDPDTLEIKTINMNRRYTVKPNFKRVDSFFNNK